jgi:single-strand DNA-binding protein
VVENFLITHDTMSFEVEGKLHKKFETVQVKDTFKKREFVLELESGAYTQLIKFQATQDRCNILDNYPEDSLIKVYFDLRGRAWTGRDGTTSYFTNLEAWKIENPSAAPQQQQQAAAPSSSADSDFPSLSDAPPFDDLPF